MTDLICIVCPKGCRLTVDENNGYAVTGNTCVRGEKYGKAELKNPVRVVTSTVKINSSLQNRCPVKTNGAVPKNMIFDVMNALNSVVLTAPVKVGDIVLKDICGTGIDALVTKNIFC